MANSFTPQQIEEFLQEFFDVVGARQYIGARYVPVFGRAGEDTVEWDDGAPYEPLTVVMHEGVSYVSRRYVPTGIQITNTDYWVETYRFNAQVEQYRQEVLGFQTQIDQIRQDVESDYVPFPDPDTYPKYGLLGQVLTTLTGGGTKWEDPVTVDAAIAEPLIEAWLNDHPEATTTVQDNSLTYAKFAESLRNRLVKGDGGGSVTDANDAPHNSVIWVNTMAANLPANATNWTNAILVTLSAHTNPNVSAPRLQLCCCGNPPTIHELYFRTIWGSGSSVWSDWEFLATIDDLNDLRNSRFLMHTITAASESNPVDANGVGFNTIMHGAPQYVSNIPQSLQSVTNVMLITFASTTNATATVSPRFQLCVGVNPRSVEQVWYRTIWGSSSSVWGEWSRIAENKDIEALRYSNSMLHVIAPATSGNPIDANTLNFNTIYHGAPSTIYNIPSEITSGNVIMITFATPSSANSVSAPRFQLCVESNTSAHKRVWHRTIWGSAQSVWSEWDYFTTNYDNYVSPEKLYSLAAFNRIAGVGDSYMAGAIYKNGGSSGVESGLDTGIARQIARNCNNTVIKYAVGGRGAYNFIHASTNNLADLISDGTTNPYDLVLLEFGINDASSTKTFGDKTGGLSYLGSSADIAADYHDNENSFWGCMSYIISALKEAFPSRKIALIGMCDDFGSSTTTLPAFNNAIREIAAYHGVLFIDVHSDPVITSDYYTDLLYGGHPNYQAYNLLARVIDRQFSLAAIGSTYIQEYYGSVV